MAFNLGILISGKGSNMLKILEASKRKNIMSKIVTVVSNNPHAPGLKKAIKFGVDVKVINDKSFSDNFSYEKKLSEYLQRKNVNLICLAGFMKILSKNFITKWNGRIINIHPSLLPAFKGLNTHEKAIKMNVKFSGCTVHFVNEELDSGSIIDQEVVEVNESDNKISLQKKILMKEHNLYIKVIKNLENSQ